MRNFLVAAALGIGLAAPAAQAQQRDTTLTWSERVPDGRWINVRNLNGPVRVERGSSDMVEITAVKHVRRGDGSIVRFETAHYGPGDQDFFVCAVWGEGSRCTPDGYEGDRRDGDRTRRNEVMVEFTVKVPAGVKVAAHTVNSGVSVSGAGSEVNAGTVNGPVEIETSGGPVSASSVNGPVRVSMLGYRPTQNMDFSTVNGSVIVEFGGDIDAEVDLSTVNGRFVTDFPVTLSGRVDPRHLHATLGKGGPRLTLTTVNGNVELRKH
ncbi:MAG TPA: hypothetical protein VG818_02335 [Gemmatimonadaceae bacterium]|nr:hypothetical protein [Gemmatimonadaceae bacterium]